jgi:hypothetical protein
MSLWIVGGVILSPDAKAATDTFKLVKSIDELTDGGTYILYANSNVAASWNSKNKYYATASISDYTFPADITDNTSYTKIVIAKNTNDKYTLYDTAQKKYISVSEIDSNNTKDLALSDSASDEKAQFNISFDAKTYAAVIENGNTIQYNSSSPRFKTYKPGNQSAVYLFKRVVPMPNITDSNNTVTITNAEGYETYKIYYTTDGSDPTTASTQYEQPFAIDYTVSVVKAIAVDNDGIASDIAEEDVEFESSVANPTITTDGNLVTLATKTEGATIHFTLDGTVPTLESYTYTAPFDYTKAPYNKTEGCTITAIAWVGEVTSGAKSDDLEYCKVATPTFTPAINLVKEGTKVTIACATEGAAIYYAINNGEYAAYTADTDITINTATTLKVKATKANYVDSDESATEFKIAEEISKAIKFADKWGTTTTQSDIREVTYQDDPFSITFAKNNSGTNPAYNKDGTVRLYKASSGTDGCSMTVSVNDGSDAIITSVTQAASSAIAFTVAADGKSATIQNTTSSTVNIPTITIKYNMPKTEGSVGTVSFSQNNGATLLTGSKVELTNSTENPDAAIAYRFAEDADWVAYDSTKGVTLDTAGEITLYVKASQDGMTDWTGSCTYTVIEPLVATSIANFIEQCNKYNNQFSATVNFPLTVTYARSTYTGAQVYATDGAKDIMIYNSNADFNYKRGDVIPAGWTATYSTYNTYIPEMVVATAPEAATETAKYTPAEVFDLSTFTAADVNKVVMLKEVTFAAATPTKTSPTFAGTDAAGYKFETFMNSFGLDEQNAGTYDVEALVSLGSATKVRLVPIAYTAVVYESPYTFDFTTSSRTRYGHIAITADTKSAPSDGYSADDKRFVISGDITGEGFITSITDTDETIGIKSIKLTVAKPDGIDNDEFAYKFVKGENSLYTVNYIEGEYYAKASQNVDDEITIDDEGNLTWEAGEANKDDEADKDIQKGNMIGKFDFIPENNVYIAKAEIAWDYVKPEFIDMNIDSTTNTASFKIKKGHKLYYAIADIPATDEGTSESENTANAPHRVAAITVDGREYGEVVENTEDWSIDDQKYTYDTSKLPTEKRLHLIQTNGEKVSDVYTIGYGNDGVITSIGNVATDLRSNNGAVEYYNMQGVRVANPTRGLYIRRQGTTVTKVLVK